MRVESDDSSMVLRVHGRQRMLRLVDQHPDRDEPKCAREIQHHDQDGDAQRLEEVARRHQAGRPGSRPALRRPVSPSRPARTSCHPLRAQTARDRKAWQEESSPIVRCARQRSATTAVAAFGKPSNKAAASRVATAWSPQCESPLARIDGGMAFPERRAARAVLDPRVEAGPRARPFSAWRDRRRSPFHRTCPSWRRRCWPRRSPACASAPRARAYPG